MADNNLTRVVNIPVFRSSSIDDPAEIVGVATLEFEGPEVKIVIRHAERFVRFLEMGELKALSVNATITNVSPANVLKYQEEFRG